MNALKGFLSKRTDSTTALLILATLLFPWIWGFSAGEVRSVQELLFANYLFPALAAAWVIADAQKRGHALPYDFDTFAFFAWPLVIPIYLVKTKGWRSVFYLLAVVGIGLVYTLEWYLLFEVLDAVEESGELS